MNLPLFIGLRYTGAHSKTQLVSFFSGVSICGLVVGVGLLVAVLSIMNGFDRELREKILGLVPQGAVYERGGVADWPALQERLQQNPGVVAAAPFVQLEGLVSYRGRAEPVVLYGLKPEEEKRVSRIAEFIDQETLSALSDGTPQLLLGLNIANRLQVEEGEQVMMVVPNTDTQAAPRLAYFHLLRVLRTETELDNALAITHIDQAAQLTGTPEAVTGMRLMVTDLFAARDIVWESIAELGFGFYGSSWINTHGNLYQAIQMSKKLVTLLMSLIVAIAAFNVVSTLVMVVVEKQGDIAILRTYGASTSCIMAIFMVQGSVIGLLGTLLGLGFGLLLTLVVEPLLRFFEAVFGMQFLKSDVYPLTYLPTEIRLDDLVQVGITALIMSFLATIYPAWRASRSRPADVLRYE